MKSNLYTHSNFVVKATPMNRWEFALQHEPDEASDTHRNWKYWNGYCCDWFGFRFWVDERQFHEQWDEVPENLKQI